MKTVRVCLDSIDKVKGFVTIHESDEMDEILKIIQPYIVDQAIT